MLSPSVDTKGAYDSTQAELRVAAGSRVSTSHSDCAPSSGSSPSSRASPPEDTDTQAPKYSERAFENVYLPPGGEEPPPDFTPYDAEFFISGNEIISHDPHLNEDGEALYRFLLSQSATRPEYMIHARGTHTEHKSRTVTSTDSNGNTTSRSETYTETVTDFDFYVDLTPQIVYGPVHWSLPDAEPAYRGEMYMQVDSNELVTYDRERALPSGRRESTNEEQKAARERKKLRKEHGLPPWVASGPESWFQQSDTPQCPVVLQSSKTLRQWADEYCASDKLLKEFTYTKIVYGWNTANLHDAIIAAIRSVYGHDIRLSFDMSHHKIRIRPDSTLSRTLSNKWFKFLLWIFLIYPLLWLFKRFNSRGGGRWEVCGGAYALKTWQIQPPGSLGHPPSAHDGRWQQTPNGWAYLVGEREGEWFQRWEWRIRAAVRDRLQSKTPLEVFPGPVLDGYGPSYVGPPPIVF